MRALFLVFISVFALSATAAEEQMLYPDFVCQIIAGNWFDGQTTPYQVEVPVDNRFRENEFYLLPDGRVLNGREYAEAKREKPELENLVVAVTLSFNEDSTTKTVIIAMGSKTIPGPDQVRHGFAIGWDGVGTMINLVEGNPWGGPDQGHFRMLGASCMRKEIAETWKNRK